MTELVLSNLSNILKCNVCTETLKDPRVLLPCLHVFCKGCLENLMQFQHDGSVLVHCPNLCPDPTRIGPQQTASDLSVAHRVKEIIDVVVPKEENGANGVSLPPCNNQGASSEFLCGPSTVFCCGVKLCARCNEEHAKSPHHRGGVGNTICVDSGSKDRLSVMCGEHGSLCTHICTDRSHEGSVVFLCLYCRHRDHKQHPTDTIVESVQKLQHTLQDDSTSVKRLEEIRRATEDRMTDCAAKVERRLRRRKLDAIATYMEEMCKQEEKIRQQLNDACQRHLKENNSFNTNWLKFKDKQLCKHGINLLLDKHDILQFVQSQGDIPAVNILLDDSKTSAHPLGQLIVSRRKGHARQDDSSTLTEDIEAQAVVESDADKLLLNAIARWRCEKLKHSDERRDKNNNGDISAIIDTISLHQSSITSTSSTPQVSTPVVGVPIHPKRRLSNSNKNKSKNSAVPSCRGTTPNNNNTNINSSTNNCIETLPLPSASHVTQESIETTDINNNNSTIPQIAVTKDVSTTDVSIEEEASDSPSSCQSPLDPSARCDICGKQFSNKTSVKRHLKRVHRAVVKGLDGKDISPAPKKKKVVKTVAKDVSSMANISVQHLNFTKFLPSLSDDKHIVKSCKSAVTGSGVQENEKPKRRSVGRPLKPSKKFLFPKGAADESSSTETDENKNSKSSGPETDENIDPESSESQKKIKDVSLQCWFDKSKSPTALQEKSPKLSKKSPKRNSGRKKAKPLVEDADTTVAYDIDTTTAQPSTGQKNLVDDATDVDEDVVLQEIANQKRPTINVAEDKTVDYVDGNVQDTITPDVSDVDTETPNMAAVVTETTTVVLFADEVETPTVSTVEVQEIPEMQEVQEVQEITEIEEDNAPKTKKKKTTNNTPVTSDVSCCRCDEVGDANSVVTCDDCKRGYHFATCISPPYSRNPKQSKFWAWFCETCETAKRKAKNEAESVALVDGVRVKSSRRASAAARKMFNEVKENAELAEAEVQFTDEGVPKK